MLRKKIYFFHHFDAKMDYSLHYSLLKVEEGDGIHFNDSVQQKKCNHRLGRWNFIVGDEDFSCGVYHALEIIRQSIFSAKKNSRNNVAIALVPTKSNADICYVFNYERELNGHIDLEQLKEHTALSVEHNENCKFDTKISRQVFFKVIKPVLDEMFKKLDYKITTKTFKDEAIREHSDQSLINFKRDIEVVHIEWRVDKFFNDFYLEPTPAEIEFQLSA